MSDCSIRSRAETLFCGTECLAPMVRAGSLPMRLLALDYGADTVWGEELIDRKVELLERKENNVNNTIDYVMPSGALAFRTTAKESGKIVFQLGTASAACALRAAEKIAQDVAAVDINMGCPKKFSVSGGMGAALLSTPHIAADIIRTLSRELSMPITAKIRILPTVRETVELCRRLEHAGSAAISVHCRERHTSYKEPADWSFLKPIVDVVHVPVVANGDIYTRKDMDRIRQLSGCSGVMLARPALFNCSVFRKCSSDGLQPRSEVIREYIRCCLDVNHSLQGTKYVVAEMMSSKRHPTHLIKAGVFQSKLGCGAPRIADVSRCKSINELAELWSVEPRSSTHLASPFGPPPATFFHFEDDYVSKQEINEKDAACIIA